MKILRKAIILVLATFLMCFASAAYSTGDGWVKEIVLQLTVPGETKSLFKLQGNGTLPVYRVNVMRSHRVPGQPVRQRNPELSLGQLVVVGVDMEGEEISRVYISDPRIIRSESISPTGKLSSEIIYKAKVEFPVIFTDNLAISRLMIYQPRWTGSEFILDLIAGSNLP